MKSAVVRKLSLAVLAVAFAAVFAACGSDSTTAPPTTGPFTGTIQVKSNFFSPASATIAAGDSVTWVWSGSSHSVTEGTPGGAHAFDSGVKSSGKFGHRFNTAGTVHYFCTVHGSAMSGTIIVKP
jgi:plastocyanin